MLKKKKQSQVISEERETGAPRTVTSELSGIKNTVLKSLWEDLLKGSAEEGSEQITGKEAAHLSKKNKKSGELKAGEEITLTAQAVEKALSTVEIITSQHHQEYFKSVQSSEAIHLSREHQVVRQRVDEILVELKKLASVSKEMQTVFKQISTEQTPTEVGQYHINFYEWVLLVVQNARARIEEGASWLSMFASKKKQKQYWNMYKKHGTTFGLSQERSTATQVG